MGSFVVTPPGFELEQDDVKPPAGFSLEASAPSGFEMEDPTTLANRELAKQGLSVSAPRAPRPHGLPPPLPETKGATMDVYDPSPLQQIKDAAKPFMEHLRAGGAAKDPRLLAPERLMNPAQRSEHPHLYDISQGAGEFAGELTTGDNLALMAASGGLGQIPGAAGKVIPRLASAAFGAQMLYGAGKAVPQIAQSVKSGDIPGAEKQGTEALLGAGMGAFGLRHAATGGPHAAAGDPISEAAQTLMRKQLSEQMASRVANGQPPVPPPPPKPPVNITEDQVTQMAEGISRMPQAQRSQALMEAHEKLAQLLGEQGKMVNPTTGEILIADSPKAASSAAAKIINDAVKAHDAKNAPAAVSDNAKAARQGKKPAAKQAAQATQELGDRNADAIQQLVKPTATKAAQGEPVVPMVTSEDGSIPAQIQAEGLRQAPQVQVPPAGLAQVGTKDPESGRTVVQPVNDPVHAQALATQAAPEMAQRIEDSVKGVPDTEFARLRPQKKPERVAEKMLDEKEPANTIGDLGAGQIVVETPQAKEAIIAELKKNFKVVEPIDDFFERGKDDKGGYRAASVQVQASNGSSYEVQIVPRELYGDHGEVIEKTHEHYAAARDAELAGDHEKAEREKALAEKLNDEAWAKFQERNGQTGAASIAPSAQESPAHTSESPTAGVQPQAPPESLSPSTSPSKFTKGDRVSFTQKSKQLSGTVKYHSPEMGVVRIQPEGSKGTVNVKARDVRAESLAAQGSEATSAAARQHGLNPTPEQSQADVDAQAAQMRELVDHLGVPPGKTGEMDTQAIKQASHKFQYKLNTDAEGVGQLLKNQKVYNPDLAGAISVWRDPADGQYYVVNGHHRLELAIRTGQKSVAVRHIEAANWKAARAIGALQNIAEGRGTPVDAAKFFRDTESTIPDLEARGISFGEATAAKGMALSHLEDSLFNKVVQGDLPIERGVAIGEATDNHAEQKAIVDLIDQQERKGKKVNNDTLRELVRFVKGAGQSEETTSNLFGTETITKSHAIEKAEVSAYIKQQLAKDKKLFGFVSKGGRAEELERGNNIIDVKNSQKIAQEATQGEEVYNKLSERAGPIADVLDDAAARLAGGENANAVKQEAYDHIRQELSQALGGGSPAGSGRSRAAREASFGVQETKAEYRQREHGNIQPLTEEELASWAKSRSLKIEEAGEQANLFGGAEKMYRVSRIGSDGERESALVPESKIEKLRESNAKVAKQVDQGNLFAGYGERNRLVSKEDAEQARQVLRSKANQLNSGVDPDAFAALVKLGAYHFEAGAREFGAWSKEMLKQAGEAVKPHLQAIYDDILDRFRPAQIWKLKSSDIVQQKMKGPMPGNDLAKMLRNNGIKPDEMKWTGLDEYLKDKPKVSPAEVREFLRQNDVQVKEVVKGEVGYNAQDFPKISENKWQTSDGRFEITQLRDRRFDLRNIKKNVGIGDAIDWEDVRKVLKASGWEGVNAGTKFSQYQLPGGKNYRELLLTLPPKGTTAAQAAYDAFVQRMQNKYVAGGQWAQKLSAAEEVERQRLSEAVRNERSTSQEFRSGHFDEPNVLAHVRFNDRMSPDGKKTLFIEELQSDWHQKGRREGYAQPRPTELPQGYKVIEKPTPKTAWVAEQGENGLWHLVNGDRMIGPAFDSRQEAGAWLNKTFSASDPFIVLDADGKNFTSSSTREQAVENALDKLGKVGQGVPDAPFKSTWQELALKRMLRYAAENNYDRLAFTTGEQQAARYDLSKHVSKVQYSPESKMLQAWGMEGQIVLNKFVPREELPDYIGKDAAEKLLASSPKDIQRYDSWTDKHVEEKTHILSGLDLKVGGQGMKGFYDKIIPDFLNKYAKQWGARVGETSIGTGGQWTIYNEDGKPLRTYPSEAEANQRVRTHLGEFVENDGKPNEPAHSIDITPSMRDSVMQGQYLYAGLPLDEMARQAIRGIHQASHSETAQEVKEWIGDEASKIRTSRELQKGLYDLEGAYSADVLRAVKLFKSLPGNASDQADIYHSFEDPSIKLSPEQQELAKVLEPMRAASERIYQKLTDGGAPVENYVHRVVQGKGNFIDRLLSGSKGSPGNILSKRAAATKSRSMMALEDAKGNRKLVSVKGENVNLIQAGVNGPGLSKPIGSIETKDGERVVSVNGKLWNLKQATTKEIEAGTDLRYYKNAAASTITSYLELRRAERAYDFLESLKADPRFQDLSWTRGKDAGAAPPKGWKATKLAQFNGYYFEPHQAEVLDWYWDRIHHDVSAWDKLGRVMMTSIFYNPLLHVPNVAAQWFTEGGTKRFAPWNWKRSALAGDRAWKAVRDLNDDYIEALRAGAPLAAYRPEANQLQKLFFDQLGDKMTKDAGFKQQMDELFGKNWNPYALSHKITWGSNDVLLLQSIYEHMGRGESMKEAIRKATEIIPDYRLPTRMFDSPATAKILSNRGVTMFMPYHYGVLKSAAKIAEGMAKGDKDAYDRLIALALLTYVLYPLIDQGVKKLSGEHNARMKRSGVAGLVDNVQQVVQGHKNPTQALQSVITPAVHTKTAVELGFNRDLYTGREVYNPHAPAGKIAKQIGRKLISTIGPAEQAVRAYDNKHDARKKVPWGMVGVTFPNNQRHR